MNEYKTSLSITKEQKKFLDAQCINVSKFVRSKIQELQEERKMTS